MGIAFFLLISACVAGALQNNKGESVVKGFLVGLLFGPLGVIAVVATAGRPCPACRTRIHHAATRCPKCCGEVALVTPKVDHSPRFAAAALALIIVGVALYLGLVSKDRTTSRRSTAPAVAVEERMAIPTLLLVPNEKEVALSAPSAQPPVSGLDERLFVGTFSGAVSTTFEEPGQPNRQSRPTVSVTIRRSAGSLVADVDGGGKCEGIPMELDVRGDLSIKGESFACPAAGGEIAGVNLFMQDIYKRLHFSELTETTVSLNSQVTMVMGPQRTLLMRSAHGLLVRTKAASDDTVPPRDYPVSNTHSRIDPPRWRKGTKPENGGWLLCQTDPCHQPHCDPDLVRQIRAAGFSAGCGQRTMQSGKEVSWEKRTDESGDITLIGPFPTLTDRERAFSAAESRGYIDRDENICCACLGCYFRDVVEGK